MLRNALAILIKTINFFVTEYNMIKDQPGDSYFVRAMFSRCLPTYHGHDGSPQLAFKKDDILYIDNTMYNGVPGNWSAWIVDVEGKRGQWGIIPSKYKVDEELLMKRQVPELSLLYKTSIL